MCDQDALVGYLYDELSADERKSFEQHLEGCSDCRAEVSGLRATRARLPEWTVPEADHDIEVVRAARPVPVVRRTWPSPAWGLAAAAVLVLAAAAAIAHVEVRYDASGFSARTGWNRGAAAEAPTTAAVVAPAAPASFEFADREALQQQLVAIQARLDRLEVRSRETRTPAAAAAAPADAAVLRRVETLVRDSEARQQQLLAQRLLQLWRDVSVARRTDMETMQRGLMEVQGVTDTTVRRQQQMESQFYRAVGQRQR
jgi:Putative zinc-finger